MTDKPTRDIPYSDADLEVFFEAAIASSLPPSARLMAAIEADAEAAHPKGVLKVPGKSTWWQRLSWPAQQWQMAGTLTACAVLGIWIGYASPAGLSELSDQFWSSAGYSVVDEEYFSLDALIGEG